MESSGLGTVVGLYISAHKSGGELVLINYNKSVKDLWDAMTPTERKVFRAVGKAQVATGLAVFTQTNFGKGAIEQLDALESVGVKPERVTIGHAGGLTDPKAELLKAICKRGAFVGFDRQGGPSDSAQVPAIMALLDAGYADNLLFSSDFSFASDLKRNGGPGYAKTVTVFGICERLVKLVRLRNRHVCRNWRMFGVLVSFNLSTVEEPLVLFRWDVNRFYARGDRRFPAAHDEPLYGAALGAGALAGNDSILAVIQPPQELACRIKDPIEQQNEKEQSG